MDALDENTPRLASHSFDLEQFGHDFESGRPQVEYLRAYLGALGARSFVREQGYIDRHFLDDFTNYYARAFRSPEPRCRRLHYFNLPVDELEQLIEKFYADEGRTSVEALLNKSYLGFVVRRPLRGARIGRTVLRTYGDDPGRLFTVVRPYHVHLGAIRLRVDGLAFQEQDGGVAVCASTSLWCALQKVAHFAGQRTPTPSAITLAAESPFAASEGLTDPQMATALARLGFAADTFVPGDKALFRARLAACLRSHLPVILMVQGLGAHAITCTGYRLPSAPVDVPVADGDLDPPVQMRSGGIQILYAHDDNLGCHAHYELHDAPPPGADICDDGAPELSLWLYRGDTSKPAPGWWRPTYLRVLSAIVPKPTKLRLSVDRLVHLASALDGVVQEAFDHNPVHYDVAFSSGVSYRQTLLDRPLDRATMRGFDRDVDLPRHLAVVSVYSGERQLCDLLVDATTIDLQPDDDSLLAIVAMGVPAQSKAGKRLKVIADEVKIPILFKAR